MQRVRFKLRVHESHEIPTKSSGPTPSGLGGQIPDGYTFELLNEKVDLGVCQLDQWWIERSAIYPTPQQPAPTMFRAIVKTYWDICWTASTITEPSVKETYLLARLFPKIRHLGVRDVFRDSVPFRRSDRVAKTASATALEEMLAAGTTSISLEEFHKFLGKLLVSSEYDDEDIQLYAEMSKELLSPGLALLTDADPEVAVAEVETRWQSWKNGFGRHSGNKDKKRILDALSYASKAAFHQAYSAAWLEFINMLWIKHGWNPETARFHTFWHCIQRYASLQEPSQYTYLFRGHVLGLHPASATFMQTESGRRLIGNWLLDESAENFEMLLGGLAVAVSHYASVYDEEQINRRK